MAENQKPLTVGDAVRLNGGGTHTMTITKIDGDSAECSWQDKKGTPIHHTYPLAALHRWKPTINFSVA